MATYVPICHHGLAAWRVTVESPCIRYGLFRTDNSGRCLRLVSLRKTKSEQIKVREELLPRFASIP